MSINRKINNQTMAYLYDEIPFINKNDRTVAAYNVDEAQT